MNVTISTSAPLQRLFAREFDMCFRERALTSIAFLHPNADDHILDCGCGRGFYLKALRAVSGCRLTGVDSDPELLQEAAVFLDDSSIALTPAEISSLPFADQTFDKILFSEVLEHIPDDRQALSELWRVLKPGGTIALTVPNHRYPFLWDPINKILEATMGSPIKTGIFAGIWANHVRLYTREKLEALVVDSGFRVEDSRLVTYFCLPFAHNLLYGFGKELLLGGFLPESLARSVNRFENDSQSTKSSAAVQGILRILRAIDRLNTRWPPKQSSVVIALKLVKEK